MKSLLTSLLACLAIACAAADEAARPLHLFILSGQSNMVGLKPEVSFAPALQKALPDAEVLVVKHASGGQPIEKWYRELDPTRPKVEHAGPLYAQLIANVRKALGDRRPTTITFCWLQGEADARLGRGDAYQAAFEGIVGMLEKDLGRQDINVVIARISDFGNEKPKERPDWMKIRKIQQDMAEAHPFWAWFDTDDLNGPRDGLHYPAAGYAVIGERFAAKALELIKQRTAPTNP